MKHGCEKRDMSNNKLYNKPSITMIQCVYTCEDVNGCNSSSSIQLSVLIGLISLISSLLNLNVIKFTRNS